MWNRTQFSGGVMYTYDLFVITGSYSPNEFEGDCMNWTLLLGEKTLSFKCLQDAIDYAEFIIEVPA